MKIIIEEFLSYLCSLDIKLWADGDRLRCSAPEGTLTPSLRVQLQERKAEILAFLQKANLASISTLDPILPVPREGKLPLSFAQQRLWFLQQLEVDSGFYNIYVTVRFEGQLNVAAVEYSLNYIINRHEALRTNFVTVNGQPVQVIHPNRGLTLQVVNLQQLAQTQREITCQQLAIEEATRSFDLAVDPLVRASLLKLGEKEHVLLVVMHHIVSDGWSIGVLVRELAAVYQAACNDAPIALPELPIQYTDFAVWQQQWLQGEVLAKQLAYWKQQLRSATALLELPTDRPRPAIITYRGATLEFAISVELSEALFALSQRQGVTLFMTLLAAFQTLLSRYTGQSDICVGTPIANRNRGETEGLIGLFANTLVLRSNLSNNPSFADFLSQVREVALGAYAHQDLPFEQLVEQLQPERSLSYTPLFQVMFVLQNAPMPELELTDLTLCGFPLQSSTARFDLTLSLENTSLGLSGSIEYNTDLFDTATIKRMAGHYQTLLEAIVANPQQKLSDLALLTATEQHQILVEFNKTQAPYPKHLCLHSLFEQQVEKTPDAVAVVFDSEQLTYGQLNAKANQLAHHLRSLGVGPEVLVGIYTERSLEMVVGLLGILKAGGAYVPLDPIYPRERLVYILEDACVSVLLVQQQLLPTLDYEHGHIVCLDSYWHSDHHSSSNPDSGVQADNLAYAIYTSGSTGRPKGVQIRHSAVVNFLTSMSRQPGLVSEDVLVAVTTITFDIAALELFGPLSLGARVVVNREVVADGGQSTAKLATSSATVMQGTPATWRLLMQAGWIGNQQLKILCGGEALSRELASQLLERAATLWNMYGPTETTIWSAVSQVQAGSGSVSIGGAIANTQFYLLDANLQPVPVGVPGELHIGGDGLARGYLNRPELTAEKFIPNPFGDAGSRLYKTGDLVRYLTDGNIEYLGRIDHQVKIRGFRMELGEIEAQLSQHPSVQLSVVIAKEIAGDKRLVAYIVPLTQPAPTITELRDFLHQQLPEYMVPSYFVVLDAMPLTPNGKVDRRALPSPSGQLESHNFVAPTTPTQEMLAGIWASLLGVERVGIYDNFFESGGHSLLATQLISRVASTFAVDLPLRSLFEQPTVAALAECILVHQHAEQQRQTPPIVKVARQSSMPLSFAQQRLWFLQQLEVDSGFYNIPVAVRFQGQLNVAALEYSLNYIISRHEALRTNFVTRDGQPMQVIASSLTLTLQVVDLQQLDQTQREITSQQLVIEEATRPFDLAVDPLVRASLLKLKEKEHVLLVVMHHIVSDGWSIGVLVRELAAVYQAACNDAPIALPELPIQYTDFAVWQQQWLQGEVLESQLAYWKQQLQSATALLELPTDHPRPAVQTYRGATLEFAISVELSEALFALSQRQGVTLFMTLLAAFQTLLSRYTGQSDICVGTPIANRNRSETEGLIGLFVNTLVLRSNLSNNPSFADFLSQVREVALGAYAHQDLPFEQLVEQLQPQRSLSYTPLFQVMFVLQNAPMPSLDLTDLTLVPLPLFSSTAKFDLTLSLENTSLGLSGSIEYNTDLFDAATITRMAGHYQTLLSAIVANPQQKLSDLALLTATEQHQILVEFNKTQAPYPKHLCLHSLFEQQVEKTPDAVAVVFDSEQLTYGQLNAKANQLAHHLRSLGVGPEVLVGIYTERSLEMVVGLLGILKAGGAYVPLDPIYPRERLAYILEDACVSVLLVQQQLLPTLDYEHGHIVCLDSYWHSDHHSSSNPDSGVQADNLAYAIYTSGSTGRPKGVQIRHSAVVNFLTSMSRQPGLVSEDVLVAVTTITFDIAALELFGPLSLGARVVVNREVVADGGQSTAKLATSSATVMQGTPATWRLLMQAGWIGNQQLKILCGGEALSRELASQLLERAATLWNMYGPTETTIWSAVSQVQAGSGSVSIGGAIANTQFYLLDANLQPVPVGVPGELHIGGDGLARGYLNRPELTAEKFIPNPFGDAGSRLYKTGDLVRYLTDGNIEYLGRIDHQVKIRGFRMELGEIEAQLSQHPSVQLSVVIAKEIAGDKRLVAYIVPLTQPAPTITELRDFLHQQLPEYMVPSYFVVLDAMPLTPNGKVDRRALPSPSGQLESHNFVAPTTPTQEMLAGIWASLLGVERVGIYDNFFESGGHSLLATQLISRVASTFAVDLPLRSLFEQPTVAALAECILVHQHAEQQRQTPPIVKVARQSSMPLSFAQQRLWFLQQLEVDSGFYNIPVAVRFQGQLNVAALEYSLNYIISRHEALRTNFVTRDGQPMQVIASSLTLTLQVVDLQQLDQTQREITSQQLVIEEATRPFDLAVDPLVRASLLKLKEKEHVLLVVMHHIVSDGWSIGVLVRELAAVYQAACNDAPIALPELPIQYTDFAVWQQQWLQGEVLESQLAYWKQQLQSATALLELPTDHPRPAVQTYRGATLEFAISVELSEALFALSQRQGVTLFMTLLAAFQTLLSRYTGQSDICVGTPIANRNRSETEGLIGLFVNTLVLRSNLSNNPSFADFLSQVREVALGAYAHQDLPFEQLVEQLQPQRSLSYTPLFQVMFVLQNAPMPSLDLTDLTLVPLPLFSSTAKFDLTLSLENTSLGLSGSIEYNTDLFDAATITRMAGHYQTLLSAIVANPQQKLSDLALLTATEQHQILVEFNKTQAPYPKHLCLHSLFEQQVEKTPDAVAVVFDSEQLTYGQLNAKANQLAHHLRSLGVGPEVLVGIYTERSLEMVVGLLGILKAGGAYVPLDPIYPRERLVYILEDACVSVLLVQQQLLPTLDYEHGHIVCLDSYWHSDHHSSSNPDSGVQADNLAYAIYTSGSTGRPKGVQIRHSAVVNFLTSMSRQPGLVSEDVLVAVTTITFDIAALELFGPLSLGARVVVNREVVADGGQSTAKLATSSATVMQGTPATWRLLMQAGWIGNQQLKILCGGEALSRELASQLLERAATLWNMYGPTETTIWSAVSQVQAGSGSVSIGGAIANTQFYLLDANLQPVPVGVPGELHIGGDGLARGYLNRPELTAEKFIPNPFGDAGSRLYKTGDLVRYLTDGNIEYLGRIDHQVKIRGFRMELGEIEAQLSQHPSVQLSVVIAKEIAGDKRLVAYIVPLTQPAPTITELRDFLHQQLPEYMVPSYFVVLDAMPLTPNGKVDRRALPSPSGQLESHNFVAPTTPTQEMLAGIWASLLGVERVGIYDNFFESGGHSLLATQLISRVASTFAVDLPLRSLFEQPTVAALAECILVHQHAEQQRQTPPIVKVARQSSMPLSFAQQRLWFLQQLEVDSGFYNIPVAVRFQGQLNVAALEYSLNYIISRHEALRTNFVTRDGQPMQVIASSLTLTLQVVDLQQLDQTQREITSQQLVIEEATRPFDLAVDPLVRASLLKLKEKEHVLLVVMHHIVSDGWSIGVLVRELAAVYQAACNDAPIALPELPIQYTDFAVWQQQWLQGEVLESQLAYWKQQLQSATALLELPTDHPRPAVQTYRGATLEFAISVELSEALFALSQRQGVTLFMTLLAAFQTLLSRYTGQSDICVGTPIANRNRSETEGLIGLFVNTLVLRSNLSNNPSFADFLSQVREVALGAYAHQDLPFEQLVEQLQPQRSLSYTPLFQVMFVLQNAPMPSLDLTDLTLVPLPLFSSTAKFDLTLSLENTSLGLSGSIEYNTDLFDAATITRMAGHYQTLLSAIVANPQQKLSDLALLTATEQHQILVEFNKTQAPYPKHLCLHSLFEQQVEKTPDAVAVVFDSEQLTYGQLNAKANQLAHHLRSLGVGPEVLVGIYTERSLEMVVGLLGILKAGGAYVPLDPIYPRERLAYILEDACVSVLLVQQQLLPTLDYEHGHIVCLDSYWHSDHHSSSNPDSGVQADNLAYAIYTSGSTGRPKGVQIRHSAVVNFLTSMSRQPGLVSEDVLVAVTTITFDIAALELFGPLSLGARVVVNREVVADGGQSTAKLATSSATVMQGTPATWRLLMQAGWIGNQQLKILCGGEALSRELASQLLERAATLWNMYGPTETTIWSAVSQVQAGSGSVSIGGAIANTQFYLLDANLQPVPVGVPGELHIGGDGLARGYLNRPELTAEKFIPNPFGDAGSRLYKTGDLVRYLTDGNIEYLGRIDHQVKIRGFRMELGEIEAQLSQHPSVQLSVVIAKEIAGDKRLVAYIVPLTQPAPTITELRDFLHQQLPEYMVPSYFVVLDAMPLTPNGKVDRRALPSPSGQLESHNFVAPTTPTQEMLAGIWASLLGVERVGIYDNFFELGGDSILTIQVVAKANQAGLQLTVKQLFERQTIAELAAVVSAANQAEQGVMTGTLPLTPIQHWFFEQNLPQPAHWNQTLLLEMQLGIEPNILEQVVQQLLVHHDALRLRFERTNSGWQQKNAAVDDRVPFTQIDLSTLPEAQHKAAIEAKVAELQTSLNLSNGPVVRVAWLFLGDRLPSRLLIVIHHLAVDVVSWQILLSDLQTAYQQLSGTAAMQLPPKTTAFKHWAQRLAEYAQSQLLEKELGYWLTESYEQVASIPLDYPLGANTEASARTVSVSLSVEETRVLLEEVPKAYSTQIDDVLLTALVQVLAQWTGSNSILFNLEGHGREHIFENLDLSRTVGWFSTIFPVVLELQATDNPGETLKSVKEQLRRVPQQGIGYGLLRYLKGDPEIAAKLEALPQAQVNFNYLGQFDQLLQTSSIFKIVSESTEPSRSPIANRSHLLDVSGLILEGQLRLNWTYSEKVHLDSTVESLAHKFLQALQALIAHCLSPEVGGYTPSDFPVADLSQTDLDELIAQLQQEDLDY